MGKLNLGKRNIFSKQRKKNSNNDNISFDTILKRLKDLESIDDNTRYNSLLAISGLIENKEKFGMLIQKKEFIKIIQRVCDNLSEIQLLSCGLLKNMIIVGGSEICEILTSKHDIFGVLLPTFAKIVQRIPKNGKCEKINFDILNEIIELISFLSENSVLATEIISKFKNICEIFMNLLLKNLPQNILENISQCLNVLIDDNTLLINNFLKVKECLKFFIALFNNTKNSLYFRIGIGGFLFNLKPSNEIVKLIVDIVVFSINIKCFEKQNYINIKSQKMSLEILANMFLWFDSSNNIKNFINFIEQKQIINLILDNYANLSKYVISVNVVENISIFKILLTNCSCLNNLCLIIGKNENTTYLFKKFKIGNIWKVTQTIILSFSSLFKNSDIQFKIQFLETISSLLVVLIKNNCNINISNDENKFMNFYTQTINFNDSSLVRCNSIIILNEYLNRNFGNINKKIIIDIFLKKLTDNDVYVIIEVLNSFFDIFKNTNNDNLFNELDIINKLIFIQKKINNNLNSNIMEEYEREDLQIVLQNLNNFLVYKKKMLKIN